MFLKEGSGLHEGHTDVPPLEGGQQEVWPDFPESGRCQSIRPRGEEGPGGPDRRYTLLKHFSSTVAKIPVKRIEPMNCLGHANAQFLGCVLLTRVERLYHQKKSCCLVLAG